MNTFWLAFGLFGQLLFSARFFLQWLASEKAKMSVVPVAFWWLSIFGALVLLIYAIYRQDPIFILGQSAGFLIYTRNLYFTRKRKNTPAPISNE
ncbi:MAG: lipid-A-disaccharide synthase N-terminal domain-containing protein [Candidatus Latescibacterota bacterium]